MSDIEDVVSYYGVKINSQNKACCPIHKESTPSFSINPEQNFWYCFGACGKGGDSIEFVKEIEDCDFKTALSKVCEILGVDEKKYMEEKEISTKAVEKEKPQPLDSDFVREFIKSKGYKSNGYRGIRDEINKFFGHLTELDSDGNVKASYYPETHGGKLVGYKCRNHPKDFSHGKVGITGSMNDLSGQVKFKSPSKYVLLVGGECYSPDTEVLTKRGWVFIDQLYDEDEVFQVNNGIGDFTIPINKVKKYYDGNLLNYKSRQIDLLVTPEHNMVSINGRGFEYKHFAKDTPSSAHLFRKCSIFDKDDYCISDDQLRFIVAYSADSKVDVRKSGNRVAHFNLMKDRKIERLKIILDSLGMKYTSYGKDGRDWKCGRKYHTFNVHLEHWVPEKGIPVNWVHNLSLRQKKIVLEELIHWDGNHVKNRNAFEFSSKRLDESEVVQSLAVTSGLHAVVRSRKNHLGEWYSVRISNTKTTASYQSVELTEVSYKGYVYCVTVPKGQLLVRRNGKVVVCGNCDKTAAFQMLLDASQEGYNSIPVVSPTSGENSAAKQCAAQYEWFDQYDIIVIGLDNDAAGIKAAEEVAKVLPKEKVRIARWSGKDPNQMLIDGKQKQFVRDFYNAKEYVSSGILTSSNGMLDKVKEELLKPRITLPPHMHKLQAAMKGGVQQGRIVNIIADTSVGKSITVNNMVYHWIFNAPEPVGVCSLEATAGQYTLDMLSIHLEKNLQWMGSGEEVLEYLDRGDVKLLYEDLLYKEDGSARWCILDERDGDIKRLEKQCERMVSQYGCKIIVIDVLTDILRGTNADSQEDHMAWQKRMVKNGVTIINVLHSRKPPANADGKLRKVTEYDAFGSGTFIQSAAINIVLNRDKMSSDPIERNTTIVDMPKCRGGITGEICKWYYDPETRKVYDFDDWIGGNKPLQLETPLPELGEDGVFNNIPDYEEYQEMEK